MSKFQYFAADYMLAEAPNPYVKELSVNQAKELGLELKMNLLKYVDPDAPGTVLYCEDEDYEGYPNIFRIHPERETGTDKEYICCLEWAGEERFLPELIRYIREQIHGSLVIGSVWLGTDGMKEIEKETCSLDELNEKILSDFFSMDDRCRLLEVTE